MVQDQENEKSKRSKFKDQGLKIKDQASISVRADSGAEGETSSEPSDITRPLTYAFWNGSKIKDHL